MATIQFNGIAVNMYEADLGWADFGQALIAVASEQIAFRSFSAGHIVLNVTAPVGGSVILNGRFNFSSEAAILASTLTSFTYSNGFGASVTIGGLGQSFNALIDSLDTLGTTASNDTLIGYSLGDVLVGDRGNDRLLGGGGGDALFGDAGNDSLDGQFAGRDLLVGGTGNDTYTVGVAGIATDAQAKDLVVERPNEGIDKVLSYISYVLGDNVERLTLLGTESLSATGNALNNVLAGNTGDNLLDGQGGVDSMTGGAGDDTYIVDVAGDTVTETLAGAAGGNDLVRSSASFVLGLNLEALTLTGSADINATGNALANTLTGNDGDNRLDGAAGADTMAGGPGDDTYVVDNLADVVDESTGDGSDTVVINRSVDLGDLAFTGIENATLSGTGAFSITGTAGDNRLVGNTGANTLTGAGGNDYFDGGAGADIMIGGDGNDTYVIDSVRDRITDAAGTNTLLSSINVDLRGTDFGAIARAVLLGTAGFNAIGSDRPDDLTGNSGANKLDGSAGADTMTGGTGNDTYVVDDAGDQIVELLNQGTDTVLTSIGVTLADNVEILTLTITADALLTGNGIANTITGNTGNDTLDGGSGNDTLKGLGGNDVYIVDSTRDVVTELLNQGNDRVDASASFVLGLNLEALTLTGNADINATGNTLANALTGNDGNNVLNGLGGADTMIGGLGDDTYVIDNLADVVDETTGGGGTDTVVINRSVNLAGLNFTDIENATLTGTGAFAITGTADDNRLIGNAGANTLTGAGGNDYFDGGAGGDSMIGGAGDDTYVIDSINDHINDSSGANTLLSSINVDLEIAEFGAIDDVTLIGNIALLVQGSFRSEQITGNARDNTLFGNFGDDTLTGAGGNDLLLGGIGNDNLDGGDGNDEVIGDSGDDLLLGGAGNDVVSGGRGNDTLDGGAGADTLSGGLGDDVYLNVDSLDIIAETADGGRDTIQASTSITLGETVFSIESVELLGTDDISAIGSADDNNLQGNTGDNVLDGAGGNDTLIGDDGNDTLIGGTGNDSLDGGLDADNLTGGSGNDTYVWGNDLGDVVTELADGGTDTILSAVTLALADFANFENAGLIGAATTDLTGTADDNQLSGNVGDNELHGLGGNDTLLGSDGNDLLDGGTGDDSMDGGVGDDTYLVDAAGDVVRDILGGLDVVRTSVDFTLTGGVEQAEALGSGNIALTGTGENNRLTGNDGDNRLDGGGGFDTLIGGQGNDTYLHFQQGVVTIVENADEGTDTISAIGDVFLTGPLANIENAVVDPTASTFNVISLTGNAAVNRLEGGAGANGIDGGAGADTMIGGDGNDTYFIDDAGDEVVELADQGNDLLSLNRSVDLRTDFANIERFQLTGSADLTMTGNDADNVLVGNAGANRIDGGAGADFMAGEDGNDTYVVDNAGDQVAEGGNGIDLVEASISYTLGNSVDNLLLTGTDNLNGTGNIGNNVITGNAGDNVLDGGGFDDTLFGGEGNDTLIGGQGTDRLDGGGDDDVLTFDFSELFLDGGTGTDLMRVTGVGQPIRLADAGPPGDAHRYQGIEIIDLTGSGNNSIAALTWLQVLDLSDDDRLIVDGNAGDSVASDTGQDWTQGADQTVGGNLYNAWTSNGATLLIDPDVSFTPL